MAATTIAAFSNALRVAMSRGRNILGEQVHHRLPCLQREIVARQYDGGRTRRIRQRKTDRFGDAGHRVGGELAAAGACAGTRVTLELVEIARRHLAGGELADAFEDIDDGDVLALELARHDRAAIEEHARHVQTQHRHHHAGKRLVAAGNADQRVVAMAAHREFDGVRNHLARDERRLHALHGPSRCRP